MSSAKQIAANRANAKRSTGPNTSGGKARSRMNAWKHGLRAETVVIAGEDAKELQAIQGELWEEHQPSPGMESLLVERLAHYAWRMRRALVFEAALLGEGPIRPLTLGYAHGNAVSTLLRYEMALANASYRTLQQLLFLQDRRRERKSGIVEAESPVEITARLVPAVAAE
jgi:broad specificity phosphatase PhoE